MDRDSMEQIYRSANSTRLKDKKRNQRRREKYQTDIRYALRVCFDSMKQRCYNPNAHTYKHYGGRGITICDEWLENNSFIEWALTSGWERGLQIDRIDNDGAYSPDNCRWTTPSENCRNRRAKVTDFEKGTRICWKCKQELPFEAFSKDKSDIVGKCRICKECEKKRQEIRNE